MKQYASFLIVVVWSLLIFSCGNNSLRMCDKVKNGKFYYFSKHKGEKIFVERRDSIQIEAVESDSFPIKGRVVWKNDCSYDMFFIPPKTVLTAEDSVIASTPGHVEIMSVNDNYYVCIAEMTMFDSTIKVRDTIYFAK